MNNKDNIEERNEPLDEDLAWELKMFIENDEQLYNNMFLYIVRNMKRKIKRGIFDENKVKDAMLHLVNAGAQKCTKDYHKRGKWFEVFSMATRKKKRGFGLSLVIMFIHAQELSLITILLQKCSVLF